MAHALPTNIMTTCSEGAVYCLFSWANSVTNGFFTTGLLLTCCVVILMATQRFGMPRAYGFSSFVGLIGAIFLVTLKLMPFWSASIFIIAGTIGFVILVMNER